MRGKKSGMKILERNSNDMYGNEEAVEIFTEIWWVPSRHACANFCENLTIWLDAAQVAFY